MSTLVLKVDVDTYAGTRDGVPRLIELFQAEQVPATFLFSLGPDHTGRAIKRVFRPGFFKKVRRTKVTSHYGFKTLLYGTLLPGPNIGVKCAEVMRSTRDAGFECGVHTWDHVAWQDKVMGADEAWTLKQMQRSVDRFQTIFGEKPTVHGAAGWQMNKHALRGLQKLGFTVASDGRGDASNNTPYLPLVNAEPIKVPQLPTTLPTLDELLGLDDLHETNVATHLLGLTKSLMPQVYTLHAELEGGQLLPVMRELIQGWKAQGYQFQTLSDYAHSLSNLPHREVTWGEIPGRSGQLMTASSTNY
jgi:undecaprenyl phosphate-alpha-L-ara4FN deformylase